MYALLLSLIPLLETVTVGPTITFSGPARPQHWPTAKLTGPPLQVTLQTATAGTPRTTQYVTQLR